MNLAGIGSIGSIAGIPVVVKGQIIGRGVPGYVLSADMVVAEGVAYPGLLLGLALRWLGRLSGGAQRTAAKIRVCRSSSPSSRCVLVGWLARPARYSAAGFT